MSGYNKFQKNQADIKQNREDQILKLIVSYWKYNAWL